MQKEIETLLESYAVDENAKDKLAPWIAENSIKLNHLYEDLGLKNRAEMGVFMSKNFPLLALKKPKELRWKKFLFDTIGKTAPACKFCPDITTCHSCDL